MSAPAQADPQRKAWVEQVMGMPISIHLRGGPAVDSPAADVAVLATFDSLREMDRIFSTYRPDSDVARLRREEVQVGDCHPLVAEAMHIGESAERATHGAFTTLLPTGAGDLAFDPTGLVKGWAVDLAAVHLESLPGVSFCINAGGDLLIGAHPGLLHRGADVIEWRIGIEDPRDRSRIASTVTLTHGAVATSGTAARGAHLYDPTTGEMIGRAGSVTVIGPTLLWADIWATALFVGDEVTQEAFALRAPDYLSTQI